MAVPSTFRTVTSKGGEVVVSSSTSPALRYLATRDRGFRRAGWYTESCGGLIELSHARFTVLSGNEELDGGSEISPLPACPCPFSRVGGDRVAGQGAGHTYMQLDKYN